MRTSSRGTPAVLVCALVVVLLSGCGSHRALAALKSDPMATAAFPHTTLHVDRAIESSTAMGRQQYASVNRAFRLAPDADPQTVFNEAVRKANQHGWLADTPGGNRAFYATKTVNGGRASLSIGVTDINGPWELDVILNELS